MTIGPSTSVGSVIVLMLCLCAVPIVGPALAADQDPNDTMDLFEMSLEELMEIEVITTCQDDQEVSRFQRHDIITGPCRMDKSPDVLS